MRRSIPRMGLAVVAAAGLWAGRAEAAITQQASWAEQYAGTNFPNGTTNASYAVGAGSGRLLVVAVASTRTSAGAISCSASYGGVALASAADDGASTATWNHTFLFTLYEHAVMDGAGKALAVSCSGGTSYYNWVYAAVYAGVDATTPITSARNYNDGNANTAVGPFSPTLTVGANDQAIEIVNMARPGTNNTFPRTITTFATGWTTAGVQPASITTNGPTATLYIRDRNVRTAANDGSQHTANNTAWDSMTALSMKEAPPTNITIANGADPGGSTIASGQTAAMDAFTVATNSGTATITDVTVAIPSNAAALSDVFVNGQPSCTGTTYGSLGAAPTNGNNTITLTTSIGATPTSGGTNYYVCVTGAAVASSTPVTGNLSSVTAAGYTVTDADSASATVTVQPLTVTVGNGADPGNASITKDGVAALDAFTLQTNSGTATVTAITVSIPSNATALAGVFVNGASSCAGTTYGSLGGAPANGNNAITLSTSIPATTSSGGTSYYVCATGGTVVTSTAVTGNVASVTAAGYLSADLDASGPTVTVTQPPSITIGNGAAQPPSASVRSGETAALDTFTLQTSSGTAAVTSVTVGLTNGTALAAVSVNGAPDCGAATRHGSTTTVGATSATVDLTPAIPATTTSGATSLYVCVTGGDVVANTAVTGTVASASALGYTSTDADSTGATVTVVLGTLTIGNGTDPGNASITLDGVVALDAFSLQTDGGTATVTAITVNIPANASALADLSVNSAPTCDGTSHGALGGPPVVGSNAIPLATPIAATASSGSTDYYVCGRGALVGASTAVTGNVASATAGGFDAVDADTSGPTVTVTAPPTVTIGDGAAVSNASIRYGGTAALDAFTLQTSAGTASVTAVTVSLTNGGALLSVAVNSASTCDGAQYGALDAPASGSNTVALGTAIAATTASGSTNLYVCVTGGSVGTSTNVTGNVASVTAAGYGSTDGDATNATVTVLPLDPGGNTSASAPMVSIVNPSSGAILSPDPDVRIQIRVFNPYNPAAAPNPNGIAGITSVQLSTDGGTTWGSTATKIANYDTGAPVTGATYEVRLSGLARRSYTLRARATNGVPITATSEPLRVTIGAARQGDGAMLVRDNASQLCTDCHALQTHSSEAMQTANDTVEGSGSKYGSWAVSCRDCHTPHDTRNVMLVQESITPPSVMGGQTPKSVGFTTRTGDSGAPGWDGANARPAATASFVNSDGSGPCQACHTRTTDGSGRIRTNGNFTGGSTTVTAGSAVFVAGSDVGRYVVGPDGRSYRIATVVSATQVTLSSAYQGTTTSPPNTAYFVVGAARWRASGNTDAHYTASSGTATCTGCHPHAKGFGGGESTGGGACAGCHSGIHTLVAGTDGAGTGAATSKHSLVGYTDTFTDTVPAAGDWGSAGITALSQVPPAQRSCVNMCHADHPHGLTTPPVATHQSNLYADPSTQATRQNGSATRTATNRASADFDPVANTGMCTRCHQKPIAAGRPTVTDAAYGASAHDFTSWASPPSTWQYALHDGSATARNCTKCHASRTEGNTPTVTGTGVAAVHGTSDPSLLAGVKNPATTNGTVDAARRATFVCYNCHGNATVGGNRSNKDIQSQVEHANLAAPSSGHPADEDAVHDSVAEYANAAFGNALGGAARHAGCTDCHEPHRARSGTHAAGSNAAGPPLEGAWGAELSAFPAFWSNPTSASFTKKTIVAGTDLEATLCFKCHSSYYGALPTSPSGGFTGTDTAKEFNPNNVGNFAGAWAAGETAGGFHPVLATAGTNLGAVRLTNLVTTSIPWSTTSRNLMTCSDCHESDTTTDPNGPHGSAAGFILRGPNTTWSAAVVQGSNGMPAGTFCANCHSPTFQNSRFPAHYSRSDHRVACWNCHAAIPHGGPRPGMLVASAGVAANVPGVVAGYDQSAPYYGLGTSTRKLYIVSYPANNTTNWGQNNCGCNGNNH